MDLHMSLALTSTSTLIEVKQLTRADLQTFIGTIICVPWRIAESCETWNVSIPVIRLMQTTSERVQKSGKCGFSDQALRKDVDKLSSQLNSLIFFDDMKEFVYECMYDFSRPFVAKAVEIDGLIEGTLYVVFGLNGDGRWIKLFGQQYHSREIGMHQFANTTECSKYKLLCLTEQTKERPVIKFYSGSDAKDGFHKGIPPLKGASDQGYTVEASSIWDSNFVCQNAFNDNTSNRWASGKDPKTAWIQVILPRRRIFNAVELVSPTDSVEYGRQAPKDFKIECSLDGAHWDVLKTESVSEWSQGERRIYQFANEETYQFYRISITSNHGGGCFSLSAINFGNICKRE